MNNEHFNFQNETAQDAQLRQLLQSQLPVESASPALQSRIASMATQVSPTSVQSRVDRPRPSRVWRFALSAATLGLLVTAGSIIWPRVLSKQAVALVELAQVDAAMGQVSTAHSVRFRVEKGKRIREGELWFNRGKWRIQSSDSVALFINGTSWFYDPVKKTVTIDKHSRGPFARNSTGFTLANLVHDFGNPGSKTTLTQQGPTILNGRTMKRALLENTDSYENSKILLLVDAETDLPMSADMHVRSRYGKGGHWQMLFSYNEPLSQKLFEPDFGPSAQFANVKPEQNRFTQPR